MDYSRTSLTAVGYLLQKVFLLDDILPRQVLPHHLHHTMLGGGREGGREGGRVKYKYFQLANSSSTIIWM